MGQLISWPKSARVDRICQCLLIRRQTLSHWAPAKGTPHFLVLSAALPNTSEKDRALAILESRHCNGARTTAGNWLLSLSKDQSAPFLPNRDRAELSSQTRPHTLA